MEVTFLKDHLDWKEGQIIDVPEERAEYWLRCGVAVPSEYIVNNEDIDRTLEKKLKASAKKKPAEDEKTLSEEEKLIYEDLLKQAETKK